MTLSEMFKETLNAMSEVEGKVRVGVTQAGDVDQRFIVKFLMELKGDVLMCKASSFAVWDMLNEQHSQLSVDEKDVLSRKFHARLDALKKNYEKEAADARAPKIAVPPPKIITP